MHIATATNRGYLPWCGTALVSCIEATTEIPLQLHVIVDGDVRASDTAQLRVAIESRGATVTFHVLDDERLKDLPSSVYAHGGPISCARIALAEMLGDVDICLYIDADTLAVSSLEPLSGIDLTGSPIAAVRNVVEPSMRSRLRRLGVADPLRYLNSGVLLMNLEQLRRDNATSELLAFVRRRGEDLLWVDQDALNVIFDGAWLELHPRWNAQNSFWNWKGWAADALGADRLEEATTNPGILHFEGPLLAKPWHYLSNHPYRQQYRALLHTTPWGALRLEDRTLATRLIVTLPWEKRIAAYTRLLDWRRKRGKSGASLRKGGG